MGIDDLVAEALRLPATDRLRIADTLYQSISEVEEHAMDAAMKAEVERRVREIQEGRAELVEHDEAMRRIFGEDASS